MFGHACMYRRTDLQLAPETIVSNQSRAIRRSVSSTHTSETRKMGKNGAWEVKSRPVYGMRVTHRRSVFTLLCTSGCIRGFLERKMRMSVGRTIHGSHSAGELRCHELNLPKEAAKKIYLSSRHPGLPR